MGQNNTRGIPKPYRDMVCIKVCRAEEQTSGGIIIPVTDENAPRKGLVVSVGTGTLYQPMRVEVGMVVWYGRYSGTVGLELEIGGEEYILIHESNIYAIDNGSEIPTPIYDMVVIRPIEREDEVTECGLVIPGTAREDDLTRCGEIMAVGDGLPHKPMSVNVGEVAFYTKFRTANGVDVVAGKNRYVICREREIYAVI